MIRKKVGKFLLYIIIAMLIISSCYCFWSYFSKGKQKITVKTSNNCYSGESINATIAVMNVKTNKAIDAKITATLYDSDDKKVKDVVAKMEIEKGEAGELALNVPEDLKSGKYTLKIKSNSGFYSDTAEIPINVKNDKKSNVIISFDKGIYKPGDEINYRILMLSKRDETPLSQNIKVSIYDGNDNRVYIEEAATSEYGIISGKFKLADEVNSGTYKLKVESDRQEVTKTFNVNPYIIPTFEVEVSSDKDNYIVGDVAKIKVDAKYFFGEPVKKAEIKGTVDGKEVVGLTDENGSFTYEYKFGKASKIVADFTVVDSSNYLIEASKILSCGTALYEIEVIPEYSDIAYGFDNDIYVITKKIDGTPVKTYSTLKIGKITKQVISDENGIGKVTITSSETEELPKKEMLSVKVESEDMESNKVTKTHQLLIHDAFPNLIKTNKTKYNAGEDIEIKLNSKVNTNTKNIYVFKSNELIKTIVTDDDNVKINLGDVSGLVDLYIPNQKNMSTIYNYYDDFYETYKVNMDYSKKTIFIKPEKELNILVEPVKDEYKPGDTLDVKFTTTNEQNELVNSALLVSILDEAILALADNDLSIDNIKLALEDIVLEPGMTAADLYVMALDESSDLAFNSVLLKQKVTNPDIYTKNYRNYETEIYLMFGIIAIIVAAILIALSYIAKNKEKVAKVIIPVIDVFAIFILMYIYAEEVFGLIDNLFMVFATFILSIIAYLLFLYKERDFIFKLVSEMIVIPIVSIIGIFLISILVSLVFDIYIPKIFALVLGVVVLLILLEFAILKSLQRKRGLNKVLTKIFEFSKLISRAVVFWFLTIVLTEITEFGLLIVLALYYLYRKFILKEAKTKVEDGKIVLNLNVSELVGMLIGMLLIIIVIVIVISSNLNDYRVMNDSVTSDVMTPSLPMKDSTINSSTGTLDFSQVTEDMIISGASDAAGAGSSINNSFGSMFDFDLNIMQDSKAESSVEMSTEDFVSEGDNSNEIENEIEENVRNVFLESLAFIPELVTENGVANFKTEISDNITTWNIQTIGNTKEGNVGFGSGSFKVFKEFFVEYTLPANSVVTDKVSIPVTLHNYTEKNLIIDLLVKENDWAIIGDYEKQNVVEAKSTKMIYVPIEILKDGNNTLRIEANSGKKSDIVEKTLVVKPNGLEKNVVVSSGMIENKYSQDIIFNEKAIEKTEKIKVKLYASPVVQAIENIDAMLRMPTGCFEQTSSSLYPDILVLKYLRENDLSNKELEEKALNYISKGYQKLLTYEVKTKKGGYSLYGYAPAEPVITAFGLMEFNELSEVYEVEEKVIDNMVEYLFDVQNVNGSFDYNTVYIGGTASRDDLAMNAYIIWALSEVVPNDKRLEKSISYLENKLDKIKDNYTLALIANIFANTDNKNSANEVLKMINQNIKVTENGAYIASNISDYYGTRGNHQNNQATALTSMALTKLNSNQKNNEEFVKFLVSQKDKYGSWGTTQATVLALKAINSFTQNSDIKDQTITIKLNDKEEKIEIKENALDVYEVEFDNVSKENRLLIDMKKGKITYEVIKNYYQSYAEIDDDLQNENKLSVVQNLNSVAKVNDIITQNISIKNNKTYIENGLIEINIPQGTTPVEASLMNLKYNGIIEKYEYNYNKINLYIRGFEPGEEVLLDIQYRALYPENITGGAIRFFDYYNPEIEEICYPKVLIVEE